MTKPPDSFFQLLEGNYPDYYEIDSLCSADVLSQQHFFGFFLYRGQITSVTPLIMMKQDAGTAALPDRYEYHAELTDELGSITLHSPLLGDAREMHTEIADAFNKEVTVEMMVYITPFPDIEPNGKIKDTTQEIITLWPVKLRIIEKQAEDAEFIRTGTGWELSFRRNLVSYPNEDGFHYLHSLIEKPDEPLTSGELFVMRKGLPDSVIDPNQVKDFIFSEKAKDSEINKKYSELGVDSQKFIDGYKSEIRNLKTEMGSLNKDIDAEKISKHQADIKHFQDEIFFELGQSFRGGDSIADIAKKSRPNVTKAIWRAVDKIEADQPIIGAILRKRITTGAGCCYFDDINHPVSWLT